MIVVNYYLKFVDQRPFDGITVMEYLSVFLCLAESIQVFLLLFDTKNLIERWVFYCLFGIQILAAKSMSATVQIDFNPIYSYKALEFWGFFSFFCASALIVFPNSLAFNKEKIRRKDILLIKQMYLTKDFAMDQDNCS